MFHNTYLGFHAFYLLKIMDISEEFWLLDRIIHNGNVPRKYTSFYLNVFYVAVNLQRKIALFILECLGVGNIEKCLSKTTAKRT